MAFICAMTTRAILRCSKGRCLLQTDVLSVTLPRVSERGAVDAGGSDRARAEFSMYMGYTAPLSSTTGYVQMKRTLVLFGLILAATGCGDDDFENPAVSDCYAFVNALCEYENDCNGESVNRCRREVRDVLECDFALSVSARYDTCMRDIRSAQCGLFGTTEFPDSCVGVIIVP